MRLRTRNVALIFLVAALPATAAQLSVRVTDGRGKPAADAVVELVPSAAVPSAKGAPSIKIIDQKNETFIPYVEIFRTGDQVVFRNSDTTRHHVYSFSPTRSFEFVLRPGESSTAFALDRAGVVSVGCNIHDMMITYLYVSDARWIARTTGDGNAAFSDLPAGEYSVEVWHPQLRPGNTPIRNKVTLDPADAKSTAFTLPLMPDPRQPPDREKSRY